VRQKGGLPGPPVTVLRLRSESNPGPPCVLKGQLKPLTRSLQRTKPMSSGGQVIQRVYALRVSLCHRACLCTLSLSLSVTLTLVLIHPLTSSLALICSVKRELYTDSTGCRIHSRSRTARSRSFATFTSSTHSHTSPTTVIPMSGRSMIICARAQRERTTGPSPCPEDP
jgi:hypothetical protein